MKCSISRETSVITFLVLYGPRSVGLAKRPGFLTSISSTRARACRRHWSWGARGPTKPVIGTRGPRRAESSLRNRPRRPPRAQDRKARLDELRRVSKPSGSRTAKQGCRGSRVLLASDLQALEFQVPTGSQHGLVQSRAQSSIRSPNGHGLSSNSPRP